MHKSWLGRSILHNGKLRLATTVAWLYWFAHETYESTDNLIAGSDSMQRANGKHGQSIEMLTRTVNRFEAMMNDFRIFIGR
jgi:cation transport regulator ChaC